MSAGYDPMDELDASLESIDDKRKRRVNVVPPPTDDFTSEVGRPVNKSTSTTPDTAENRPAAKAANNETASIALPNRRSGKGLTIRRPNGPMKAITASLPAHLIDRITRLRLDAEVAGTSFKLTELFSAALLELPLKPSAVAALIDRYSSQINYERSSKEDGFLEERRLSTQITPDAAQRLATIVRAVYQEYGAKLANKDLYAVAVLRLLADHD